MFLLRCGQRPLWARAGAGTNGASSRAAFPLRWAQLGEIRKPGAGVGPPLPPHLSFLPIRTQLLCHYWAWALLAEGEVNVGVG